MSNESYLFRRRKIIRANTNRTKNITGSITLVAMITAFSLPVSENMPLINVCFLPLINVFDYIVHKSYNV